MIVTAWNTGAHSRNGAGYGFRVAVTDRDLHFKPEWDQIVLELEGEEPFEVNINKETFWSDACRELISPEIGRWLRQQGLAPGQERILPGLKLIHWKITASVFQNLRNNRGRSRSKNTRS